MTTNLPPLAPPNLLRTGFVTLPLVALLVGTILTGIAALALIAQAVDSRSATDARRLAATAIEVRLAEMARNVRDYAYWSDAYRALHLARDVAWALDGNIGSNVYTLLGMDAHYVLAPDGSVTLGMSGGELLPAGVGPIPSPGLAALLEKGRASTSDVPEVATGLLADGPRIAMVAAAPLTPGTEPQLRIEGSPSLLVYFRYLDADLVAKIGRDYALRDLQVLDSDAAGAATLPLIAIDGAELGRLAWTNEQPGWAVVDRALLLMVGSLLFVATCTFLILTRAHNAATQRLGDAARALQQSEARKAAFMRASLDAIITVDQAGRVLEFNPAAERIFGYSAEEALGQIVGDLIVPDRLRAAHDGGMQRYARGAPPRIADKRVEVAARRADGSELPVEVTVLAVGDAGEEAYTACLRDLSAQRQAAAAIVESEARFRLMADNSPAIIWLNDADANCHYLSRRWYELTGQSEAEALGRGWRDAIHPDDASLISTLAGDARDRQAPFQVEYRLRHQGGGFRWMLSAGVPRFAQDGTFMGYIGSIVDIEARKQAEERLRHQAMHDALTGLPNRTCFYAQLQRALELWSPGTAVLCLDLDRFKEVNDTLGHSAGDRLLQQASRRLAALVRDGDMVARLGGDEFAVLMTGIAGADEVQTLCTRLLDELAAPFRLDEREVHVGVSIGATVATGDATPEGLLKQADIALYQAKRDGRGTARFFEPAMDAHVQAMSELERELRAALLAGGLEVNYQPQVEVATGAQVGVEALVRWRHATRGAIAPADFIPLAEATGLIVPLGAFVLREACRAATAWRDLTLAVNLSPLQFKDPLLVPTIGGILAETGLPPERLELEITEGALLEDLVTARRKMDELKTLGVRFAMDDFGTGYSSLSYLQRLPFDKLKVDRSFIQDLASGADAVAILRAVVGLGRSLGLTVTAEGVDSVEQLAILAREGCDTAQGYLYAVPSTAAEVTAQQGQRLGPELRRRLRAIA